MISLRSVCTYIWQDIILFMFVHSFLVKWQKESNSLLFLQEKKMLNYHKNNAILKHFVLKIFKYIASSWNWKKKILRNRYTIFLQSMRWNLSMGIWSGLFVSYLAKEMSLDTPWSGNIMQSHDSQNWWLDRSPLFLHRTLQP